VTAKCERKVLVARPIAALRPRHKMHFSKKLNNGDGDEALQARPSCAFNVLAKSVRYFINSYLPRNMIERTEACFGIKPEWLAADTAYGSGFNLDWLVNEQRIAPHVPVIDKSHRLSGQACQ
jgi:hypothetical protein